jgi:hypothetical protein
MFRRRLLVGLGALLIVFHVWLFGSQLWGGELADLSLVVRWLVAVGLLAGLRGLRRQGASMFWGRKAVALWLLAALLHGPALADRLGVTGAPAASDIAVTLVQVAAPIIVLASLVLLLALIVGAGRRDSRTRPRPSARPVFVHVRSRPSRLRFAPRPPPRM